MPRSLNHQKLTRRLTIVTSFILAFGAALSWQFAGGLQTAAHAAGPARIPARGAGAAQWTRTGPHAGNITAMAVSQSAPATVYAHVGAAGRYYDHALTGFFKSTDGGTQWTRMSYPPLPVFPHRFLSLAVDPTNPDVVYAGTVRSGIYKTADGGVTWSGPYGFQEREVAAIAIDPVNPSTLYASFFGQGFYKSTNGGVTWTYPSDGNGPGFGTHAIRIDRSNPSVIYTAGGDGGVFKSTDSGVHWTRMSTGLPFATVVDLAIDPSNTSTLYIGTSRGVFKSVDGAANWGASSNGLPLDAGLSQGGGSFRIAINPASPSKLYAINYFYAPGVYQSADGGATWTPAGATSTRLSLVAVSADGANVYAGTLGGGLFRSAAGGPWAEANEGLPYAAIRNIATDPNDPATVYAGSGDNVYRSVDRGQSWGVTALPPYERPIMGLVVDPSQPATLFAAPDYVGVMKSADGGLNWKQVIDAGNINVLALAIAPSQPHNLYFSTLGSRVYRGAEGGETWTRVSSQPGLIRAFAVDPSDSSAVYAAGFNLYKSTNGGASWSGLFAYGPTTGSPVNGILVDPSNTSTLYVYSSGPGAPVRKSTDGGASWGSAAAGLPATGASGSYNVSALVFDPVKPSVLYAACYGTAEAGGGVYKSTDGGASWSAFSAPLANVNALAFDLSGRTLYAGADDGLYKTAAEDAPLTFSTDLFAAAESAGTATVTVTRAGGAGAVTVNYATSGGTATAGADYLAASGSLSFAEGETSKTFDVAILDDAADEFDEAVRLTLTSADGTVLARASLVINDDDSPPALTVSDVSAPEGDFDTSAFVFHVSLSAPSAKTVTANVNNASGTAISGGGDLFAYGGPYELKFAPGETDKTVTISVRGDLEIEPDEDFFVNVSGVVNADPADPQGRGVILNDDATPTVSLSINDVSVVEGNYGLTDAVFNVTLSGPTAKTVKVDYFASSGAGTEHTGAGGTLTFAPGEVTKSFTTRVIGDTRYESDEQFQVTLAAPRNALVADGAGLLNVVNDEAPPTMSVNDVTVREGDAGDKVVTFVVTMSSAIESQALFSYETVPGTATQLGPSGTFTGLEDYGWVSGAIIIPPGQTKRAVSINVKGDTRAEPDETFFFRISNSINGVTIADGEGRGVIVDDDGAVEPAFFFGPAEYRVTEGEGEVTVTVVRAGDLSAPASVNYATRTSADPRSASPRSDYTAAAGTLRFEVGEGSKTFKVLVTDDAFAERAANSGDEFIELVLSDPTGGVKLGGAPSALVTIVDDDLLDGVQNPIEGPAMYVRQHYHDFLNREPDASGFQFWKNEITNCGSDAQCVEVKRINVSAAFFLSIEFQETGYLVYRMYKAAYGDATSPNVEGTVPVVRINEFLTDTQQIGQGVQVNVGNWQQQLEANKQAYALEFVQRQRFLSAFPASMTADEFVTKLDQNAGRLLSADEKAQLAASLGGTPADASKRAHALRQVAEHAALRQREFNRAFVLMQFFGYLRRDPDDVPDADFRGWKFWLDKLEQFNGNYVHAEMVKAFISSDEYRKRFGK